MLACTSVDGSPANQTCNSGVCQQSVARCVAGGRSLEGPEYGAGQFVWRLGDPAVEGSLCFGVNRRALVFFKQRLLCRKAAGEHCF